jgi:hypothetical protein
VTEGYPLDDADGGGTVLFRHFGKRCVVGKVL